MASYPSKQRISPEGNFTPPSKGHLTMSEDILGCHNWHLRGGGQDLTMNRTALTTKHC